MQTPRLRLRDLRAVSPGASAPRRQQTPSMPMASRRKGAPPLPHHPRPACAAGRRTVARCRLAVGDRQRLRSGASRPAPRPMPHSGAGLPQAAPRRRPAVCGVVAPDSRQVCRRQTAGTAPQPALPPDGRQVVDRSLHARVPAILRTASHGLSRSLRRRRPAARHGATGTTRLAANRIAVAGADGLAGRDGRTAVAGVVRSPRLRLRLRRRR